jgi:hypothetical protein
VPDPFAVLGISSSATLAEVRAARRRLALELHPDRGGDEVRMREVNRAFDLAVKSVLGRATPLATAPPPAPSPPPRPSPPPPQPMRHYVERDEPSFTIDVLPVEAFEALSVVASRLGEVLMEDPPYLLDVLVASPPCWCRLELLPEAGGTTVMLMVGGVQGAPHAPVEEIRDRWVDALNTLAG